VPDLRKTRKQLKAAIGILVGVDLVAAIVYFSPLVGSSESRRQQLNDMQAELNAKTRQVAPLKDLPHKVDLAGQQISEFYKKRFPSTNSQILTEIGKVTSANGVRIQQGKYKEKDSELGNLEPIEMEYDLEGNYTQLAKFINALERDDMFFIINNVTLGGEPRGAVRLTVKLETYLKAGS
jgi:type IV pilus assembly protein PilO